MARQYGGKKEENVAVAVDKDKGSQHALKWAVDHLLSKSQAVTLIHVKPRPSSIPTPSGAHVSLKDVIEDVAQTYNRQLNSQAREIFLPFRCFCTRKDIRCNEVIVEDSAGISKAIVDYVSQNAIDTLVLGSPSRSGFVRKFKTVDVPSSVSKAAPEFCTVYVINKGKIASVRSASAPAPAPAPAKASPLTQVPSKGSNVSDEYEAPVKPSLPFGGAQRSIFPPRRFQEDIEIKPPFTRTRGMLAKYEPSTPGSDMSFVSNGRPSMDSGFPSFCDSSESGNTPRFSSGSDFDYRSFGSGFSGNQSFDITSQHNFSSTTQDNRTLSGSSMEDVEAEMRRLREELKQTMEMYSSACKEALTAKQKAWELQRWKLEEQRKLEEARLAEEAALALVEKEQAKSKVAIEAAEAARRIAEMEAQKRKSAQMKAVMLESEDKKKAPETWRHNDLRYRRYTIEEIEAATQEFSESLKIGEGGYGPVFRGYLDHTAVAIKVLRPDAAQGRSQFQQEVEVLSCIRHPNMVLLLGACPEYGCLVYEYMANGSLDDRLFRRGNTPPLSWQIRFRIAAEIGTGLHFLHQAKPEPLVHRDLKPGNILLDRNYVSKISDVGLARLVPPSVANAVTQYLMTSTAGTFCYIDPEYQQTGMLGIKSDIYSLGVIFLQLITGKPPMGLTHNVERAIERGTFADMLDPDVPDWPIEEALSFAKLALKCAELRRKDRPDLGKVVLPELDRLREIAEGSMPNIGYGGSTVSSPHRSRTSIVENMSGQQSGYDSSRSCTSTSSYGGRR